MDLSVLQGPGGGKAKGRELTEAPDKTEEFNNKGPQCLMLREVRMVPSPIVVEQKLSRAYNTMVCFLFVFV